MAEREHLENAPDYELVAAGWTKLTATDPSKDDTWCKDNPDGSRDMFFRPHRPNFSVELPDDLDPSQQRSNKPPKSQNFDFCCYRHAKEAQLRHLGYEIDKSRQKSDGKEGGQVNVEIGNQTWCTTPLFMRIDRDTI